MDTQLVKRQIEELDEAAPIDRVIDTLDKLKVLTELATEMKRTLDARLISYIQANGQITIGTIRYWVGPKVTKKGRNNLAIFKAVLAATDGDIDQVVDGYLAADAFKPGACEKLLTREEFDQLFEITTKLDLKTGKPSHELLKVDDRFVDRGSRTGTPAQETP